MLESERLRRATWRPLDPQLAGAAWAGEHLVARVRLLVLASLAVTPTVELLLFTRSREARLGLLAIGIAAVPAVLVLLALRRGVGQRWIGFASSVLDCTIVTAELAIFAALGWPHLAVNSRVVYPVYFLVVGATALRYDARICLVTGLTAIVEYVLLLAWALHRGFAGALPDDLARYGRFEWDDQLARIVLLGMATVVATATVARSRQLLQLSTRDRLTALLNRGALDQRLAEELARCRRRRTGLAVALLDLDGFKKLNDTHGHLAGDEALCAVARALEESVRAEDVVARYGGEEFAIVFPGMGEEHAHGRLDALRQRVAVTPLLAGRSLRLTVSIGFALWPADGASAQELMGRADERLYKAKTRGRNRVVGVEHETATEERLPV
jgi:diguanylate cyclase (GGDEF)-like protein